MSERNKTYLSVLLVILGTILLILLTPFLMRFMNIMWDIAMCGDWIDSGKDAFCDLTIKDTKDE